MIVPAVFAAVMIGLFAMQYFSATSGLSTILWASTMTAVIVRLAMSDRENKTLLEQVRTDQLTGLGNRGRLQVDLPIRFAEASAARPITLLLFDLNGFKHFNDTFGHPAGDELLTRLGRQLRDAVGEDGSRLPDRRRRVLRAADLPARAIRRDGPGGCESADRDRARASR